MKMWTLSLIDFKCWFLNSDFFISTIFVLLIGCAILHYLNWCHNKASDVAHHVQGYWYCKGMLYFYSKFTFKEICGFDGALVVNILFGFLQVSFTLLKVEIFQGKAGAFQDYLWHAMPKGVGLKSYNLLRICCEVPIYKWSESDLGLLMYVSDVYIWRLLISCALQIPDTVGRRTTFCSWFYWLVCEFVDIF